MKIDFEKYEHTILAALVVTSILTFSVQNMIYSCFMIVLILGMVVVFFSKHKTIKPLMPDIIISIFVSILGFINK